MILDKSIKNKTMIEFTDGVKIINLCSDRGMQRSNPMYYWPTLPCLLLMNIILYVRCLGPKFPAIQMNGVFK